MKLKQQNFACTQAGPTTTPTGTKDPRPVCPKCGTIKGSPRPTCCGRGGAWEGKCGGKDDPKFYYTWKEGLQSCEGEIAAHDLGDSRYSISSFQVKISPCPRENT